MSPAARVKYHRDLWPAACHAQRWDPRDQAKRRQVALDCMSLVRGPRCTTSDPRFGADETTALFTYLIFLADQSSLEKAARWADCHEDYRAFNRAKNADWHERETYGAAGARKLQRDRFGCRHTAAGEPLDAFDPEEIRKRHITMAARHRARAKATTIPPKCAEPISEPISAPDPAYFPPDDGNPF